MEAVAFLSSETAAAGMFGSGRRDVTLLAASTGYELLYRVGLEQQNIACRRSADAWSPTTSVRVHHKMMTSATRPPSPFAHHKMRPSGSRQGHRTASPSHLVADPALQTQPVADPALQTRPERPHRMSAWRQGPARHSATRSLARTTHPGPGWVSSWARCTAQAGERSAIWVRQDRPSASTTAPEPAARIAGSSECSAIATETS